MHRVIRQTTELGPCTRHTGGALLMKVTKPLKGLAAALIAAGIRVPSACRAGSIPLGDPSFEDYVVPTAVGYAYAGPAGSGYRPTSAWVDDLDSPSGYTQDDAASNWLYNSAYGESSAEHRAAARARVIRRCTALAITTRERRMPCSSAADLHAVGLGTR